MASIESGTKMLTSTLSLVLLENANNGAQGLDYYADANTTQVPMDYPQFEFYQTEQLIFLIILFIFIMVSNTSVLIAILLSKNRKSRMNFFIMQLAIADLLTGLFSVLTDIIWKATVVWYAGNVGCKLVRFMMAAVTYGSTYVLVALSIDRLDAIARPMHFSGSSFRSKILICLAWLFAVGFSIPMLYFNKTGKYDGKSQCIMEMPEDWHWKLNITIHALLVFVIPTVIIACCYTIIVIIIWSKSSALQVQPKSSKRFSSKFSLRAPSHAIQNGVSSSLTSACESQSMREKTVTTSSCTSSRGLIPKARVKTIKMTFVIVLVFVICWSPYIIFDLLDTYGYFTLTQEHIAISIFMNSLGPLNSAANPVIYCLFSTKICNNWRKLRCVNWLLKPFTCCQNSENDDSNSRCPKTSVTSDYTLVDSKSTYGVHNCTSKKTNPNYPLHKAKGTGKNRLPHEHIKSGKELRNEEKLPLKPEGKEDVFIKNKTNRKYDVDQSSAHASDKTCQIEQYNHGCEESLDQNIGEQNGGQHNGRQNGGQNNARRTSATPFIKSRLNDDETAILMRNLPNDSLNPGENK